MLNASTTATGETLQADAWNRQDTDALMSFMSDDCVFERPLLAPRFLARGMRAVKR